MPPIALKGSHPYVAKKKGTAPFENMVHPDIPFRICIGVIEEVSP